MIQVTSIEAHEGIKPKKQRHYDIILNTLKKADTDLTYREIFQRTETKYKLELKEAAAVNKRLSELRRLNKIEKVVKRICKVGNSSCYTHRAIK